MFGNKRRHAEIKQILHSIKVQLFELEFEFYKIKDLSFCKCCKCTNKESEIKLDKI